MALHLSKSRYCGAVQCPKMLWLRQNRPEAFDESVMNQGVLETGTRVGDLARGLFGDYAQVPYDTDLGAMLRETERLMDAGVPVICEASFATGELFCSVDILKNLGARRVELYEVKSSTSVSDIYYDDVAFQVCVLRRLGYTVERACLVHLNSSYVRHGELDLHRLFTTEDLTEHVMKMQSFTEGYIDQLRTYMEQTEEPFQTLGEQCSKPYACGFFPYCTRDLPHPNVFDVSRLQTKKKLELLQEGIVSFEDLRACRKLNRNQRQQVEHELSDCPDSVDRDAIRGFLHRLSFPLYFLDFETINPAIPPFDETHPYQQLPFQYSLHWLDRPDGPLHHAEFLARPGHDFRRELAKHLCRDIPWGVCTTAYNMGFEKRCIQDLASLFPDLHDHLMDICDNVQDLMIPFQNRYWYNRDMQGSYSIKYVLPALCPGDPELDYHNLEDVHKGDEASAAFQRMPSLSPEEQESLRRSLQAYCRLDTLAMVKIWEKLIAAARE